MDLCATNVWRCDEPSVNIARLAVRREGTAMSEIDRDRRFRALIENIADAVLQVAEDGHVQYASPAVRRILGCEPVELMGRHSGELVHPDDAVRADDLWAECRFRPGVPVTAELRLRHRSGTWRTVEVTKVDR